MNNRLAGHHAPSKSVASCASVDSVSARALEYPLLASTSLCIKHPDGSLHALHLRPRSNRCPTLAADADRSTQLKFSPLLNFSPNVDILKKTVGSMLLTAVSL